MSPDISQELNLHPPTDELNKIIKFLSNIIRIEELSNADPSGR